MFLKFALCNYSMKKLVVFLIFALFLFGCIGTYETVTEPVYTSYENATGANLSSLRIDETDRTDISVENTVDERITISDDKKTAEFYFNPEENFSSIDDFSDFSLILHSDAVLNLNDMSADSIQGEYDFDSIIVHSYFEEKESNVISLVGTPKIEKKKVKQSIEIENLDNEEKDITLRLVFDIKSTHIKWGEYEAEITTDQPIVFTSIEDINLGNEYLVYSNPLSYFIYTTKDGKEGRFDWEDMASTKHLVILTTEDNENMHVEIQSQIHLEAKETLLFDPAFSELDLIDIDDVVTFELGAAVPYAEIEYLSLIHI